MGVIDRRDRLAEVRALLGFCRIVAILGARRVGKSTLVLRRIGHDLPPLREPPATSAIPPGNELHGMKSGGEEMVQEQDVVAERERPASGGRPVRLALRTAAALGADTVAAFCQMYGQALLLVLLTGFMCGMVLVVQSAGELARYGAQTYVARLVMVSLLRELAPVLTGLLAAGVVGSAIVAQIGSMAVTEQLDALKGLGGSAQTSLVWPRLLAAPAAFFSLAAAFSVAGLLGASACAGWMKVMPFLGFLGRACQSSSFYDVAFGLGKAACFGLAVVFVSVEAGLRTRPSGGASAVAASTTRAVVGSAIAVMVLDLALTYVYFVLGPLSRPW